MGNAPVFTTETSFDVLSSQSSSQYSAALAVTSDSLLEQLATDIPLLCLGLLGFAVATCLFVTQRLTLPASSVIAAIIFAFIAALLDFSQVLLSSNGGATSETLSGFFIAQEVFLVVALVFTLFFYLSYLGRPPYGELENVPQNKKREARKFSSAAWGASGVLGSFAYVILAGAIFAVAILQIMWRLIANPADGVYRADGVVEIILSVAFFVKLWLNVWLSPLNPRWKTFRNYLPVTISIFISLTIAILNLAMFEFSECSLGRFLQAIQLYILATFVLTTSFYGLKRSDDSSEIPPEPSQRSGSFPGLNPLNSISAAVPISPRTALPALPTTAVLPTRPTPQRRNTPERISTWFQRNLSAQNHQDPLQARLWNVDGNERDVEAAIPSPNAVPDDSPVDARITGKPLTVNWLDPAYNTPRDERNLTTTPEANARFSQEINLPTKTRAGSVLLSGRQLQIPPLATGLPPRSLPTIPIAATAATNFFPPKLDRPKASLPPSYYPPSRRPVSDGYPLSVSRNTTTPLRSPPPLLSRPNAEEDRPAPQIQDAFAQLDALIQEGLQTPMVVGRRESSGSSKRNSYDSGLASLRKEQEELEQRIAELNILSSSQNDSYFAQQQYLAVATARQTMTTLKVPGGRGSGSGDGDQGSINEAISSSGVSSSGHGGFMPKSGSYRSEFSLSNFPSPPPVTFRKSTYYTDPTGRNSIITTAAKAMTFSESSQDTVTRAPFVRKKRPSTAFVSNTIVPKDKEKEEEAKRPTASTSRTPGGEEMEFGDLRSLRQTREGRMEGRLTSFPSTFRDSLASSTGDSQQIARIVSSYSRRGSGNSTSVGQGALRAGKQLDVTSFIGELMVPEDDMGLPRRPWLSNPGDRYSTDSQELSPAEIMEARSSTFTPAVKVATAQAINFPSSSAAREPGIQLSAPAGRAPLQSAMKKTSARPPSNVPRARSSRMKSLLVNPPAGTLPNAYRDRPRRGAAVTLQPSRPIRQASNPGPSGTSITLSVVERSRSTPETTASTISGMPGKDMDMDMDRPGLRPETPPALPAPVGIARILAEMADEVENGDRVRKEGTRKLRTAPLSIKRPSLGTRPQRF